MSSLGMGAASAHPVEQCTKDAVEAQKRMTAANEKLVKDVDAALAAHSKAAPWHLYLIAFSALGVLWIAKGAFEAWLSVTLARERNNEAILKLKAETEKVELLKELAIKQRNLSDAVVDASLGAAPLPRISWKTRPTKKSS